MQCLIAGGRVPFVGEAGEALIGGRPADGRLLLVQMVQMVVLVVLVVLHDGRRERGDVMGVAQMPLRRHHVAAGLQAGLHHLETKT